MVLLLAVAHALAVAPGQLLTPLPVTPVLHSPLPVNVKGWTPDAVAVKTLEVATRTLVVSIVAIVVGLMGIAIAALDARNNVKQLRLLLADRQKAPKIELMADVANVTYTPADEYIGGYYKGTVALIVRNADDATATATNVTPMVLVPPSIMTMSGLRRMWGEAVSAALGSEAAQEVKKREPFSIGAGSWSAAPPYSPIDLIKNADFDNSLTSDDGYCVVAYRNDMGLTVMPGDAQSVSEHLTLVALDDASPLLYYVQTIQGRFPAEGTQRINLLAKFRDAKTDAQKS